MTQSIQTPMPEGAGPSPSQALIPQLSLPSMFWRPKYPSASAWRVHLPVAFWLVDAQRPQRLVELGTEEGTSWFAFCQALDRLNPYAECRAFTAGPPGAALLEHTASQYQELARVQQATQDEALAQLEKGSVDLLHVAPGVARTIAREWAQWQARLSSRGVVLISQAGPGQAGEALYRQVRDGRPHFLFEQAQGLAIVAVEPEQNETLGRLLGFQPGQPGERMIQQVFTRLGLACRAPADDVDATARHDDKNTQRGVESRLETLERRNAELEATLQARDREQEALSATNRQLERKQATRFEETAQLTELLQAAEAEQEQAHKRVAVLDASLRESEAAQRQAQDDAGHQRQAHEALQQAHQALERQRKQQIQQLEQTQQQLKQTQQQKQQLETAGQENARRLAELQQRLDAAESARAAQRRENVALHQAQEARFEELAELTRLLEEKEQRLAELTAQPKRLVDSLSALGRLPKGRESRRLKEDLRLVKASGLFEGDWYLQHNPDVRQSGMSGLEHFVRFGGQEGRSPGPGFDSQWYLIEYPDVAEAKANPLVHYLRFGQQEDRLPTPDAWQGERHGS